MPTGLSRWQCHIHSQSRGTTKGPSTTAASVCLARRGSQQALYLAQQQNQCVKVYIAPEKKLVDFSMIATANGDRQPAFHVKISR